VIAADDIDGVRAVVADALGLAIAAGSAGQSSIFAQGRG
jgi:hypothetical protein